MADQVSKMAATIIGSIYVVGVGFGAVFTLITEPSHEKTDFLHMRKQRRRSAAQ